jgi:hypothetical protein
MTLPVLRKSVGVLAVGVLAVSALSACKSGSGSGSTSGSGGSTSAAAAKPGASAPAGGGQAAGVSGSCTGAVDAAVAALVTVPVGAPSNPAGGALQGGTTFDCAYGMAKNKDLSGAALEAATDDTILVTVIGVDAQDQYANAVGYGAPIPVPGVGDKAEYFFFAEAGQAPDLYAIKGSEYCEVQINAADQPTELGVPAADDDGIDAAGAATVAKKEGAVCAAVFQG